MGYFLITDSTWISCTLRTPNPFAVYGTPFWDTETLQEDGSDPSRAVSHIRWPSRSHPEGLCNPEPLAMPCSATSAAKSLEHRIRLSYLGAMSESSRGVRPAESGCGGISKLPSLRCSRTLAPASSKLLELFDDPTVKLSMSLTLLACGPIVEENTRLAKFTLEPNTSYSSCCLPRTAAITGPM